MIDKIYILSAETKNFVPLELKKAADALKIHCEIIDIKEIVLIEELTGDSIESFNLQSGIWLIKDNDLVMLPVDSQTAIIPRLNEYHADIKLGILTRLESLGAKLLNTVRGMERCNDKLMTQILLNDANIKTPFSVLTIDFDCIEPGITILENQGKIKYPMIIKTIRGTHGIGVMKVDSHSSLISVAQTLSKENLDFMLQEFYEHQQSIRVIMLGSEVLAANSRGQPSNKDEFRTNSHLGSKTERYSPTEEIIAMGRRIVELFECNFCAIDFLIDEHNKIVVLEINGSPGLENIQVNHPEKNLAACIIDYIIGEPVATGDVSVLPDPSSSVALIPKILSPNPPSDEIPPVEIPSDAMTDIETCTIHRIVTDITARIDTGATICSLHVDKYDVEGNWVIFHRADIIFRVPLDRFIKIRRAGSDQREQRPIVKLDLTVHGTRINQVEFSLVNRAHMSYEVLLGQNALQRLKIPIVLYKNDESKPESEIYDIEEE